MNNLDVVKRRIRMLTILSLFMFGCSQRSARIHEVMVSVRFPEELEIFNAREGRYPTESEGLQFLFESNGYEKKEIVDPWGNFYIYKNPSIKGGKFYDLICMGADGILSDDDFIFTK